MSKLGFPYPLIDPLAFLVDEEIRPFIRDERHDLTGTGAQACPTLANNVFIIHEHVVPEGTAEIIHNVSPHLWRRSNPTAADESVEIIPPSEYAGFVLFDVRKGDNQPYIVEFDYNAPHASATPNDRNRIVQRGMTFASSDIPMMQNIGMRNPLSTIYAPARTTVRILFTLAPLAAVGGIPNPWVIGDAVSTENRIDFAGALVTGIRLPQSTYEKLIVARRKGQLGPEGSAFESPIGRD